MMWLELEAGAATDVGRHRRRNEDRYAVHLAEGGGDFTGLVLVADGMGGERGGERASQTAVEQLAERWRAGRPAGEPVADALRRMIRQTSDEIHRLGESDSELRGLGSTLVMAVAEHGFLTVAHVGDSRCYRVRQGAIECLTTDHTWVGDQIEAGVLHPEDARRHPQRNVLTRSLGDVETPAVDVRTEKLADGDLFILCSDGLTAGLTDGKILEMAQRYPRPQDLAETLVVAANEEDGSDNITVVVLRCRDMAHRAEPDDTQPVVRPPDLHPPPARRHSGILVTVLLLLLLALAAAFWFGLRLHAERLYDEGLEHLREGRLLHARENFNEIFGLVLDQERSEEIVETLLRSPPPREEDAAD